MFRRAVPQIRIHCQHTQCQFRVQATRRPNVLSRSKSHKEREEMFWGGMISLCIRRLALPVQQALNVVVLDLDGNPFGKFSYPGRCLRMASAKRFAQIMCEIA